jgi:predicted membrane protein
MDTNNSRDNIYKIIRPVLIYGGVFLIAYILSKFDIHTYLIIFIAVITGIILEKIFKKRTKV